MNEFKELLGIFTGAFVFVFVILPASYQTDLNCMRETGELCKHVGIQIPYLILAVLLIPVFMGLYIIYTVREKAE